MVRTVIGDETHVEGFVDNLFQSGATLQVGLAVGRLGTGSSRDAVFALIPTPQNDGRDVSFFEGDSAESRISKDADKRKGAKGKLTSPSLQIDIDWVGEHARQVSKMLVGGISVVGIYVFTSESSFKNSLAMLWQTSKVVAAAAHASEDRKLDQESLLLHFSYSPRRVSCRSCSFESSFSSMALRPCEWKLGKIVSTLHSFGCSYSFEIRLPVSANNPPKKRMLEVLSSAISVEATRLQSAQAVIDGSLTMQDKVLAAETSHEVELFLPYDYGGHFQDVGSEKVAGLVILSGSVRAQAYCFPRELLSRAIADMKEDIITSLRSRLEILYDEADQAVQDANSQEESVQDSDSAESKSSHPLINSHWIENGMEHRCKLPCRVFVPWLEGVLACDYLQEGETFQDLNDRCKDLLGMTKSPDPSDILEPEALKTNINGSSFWDMVGGSISDSNIKKVQPGQDDKLDRCQPFVGGVKAISNTTLFWAFSVLFVACFAAWFLTQKLGRTQIEHSSQFSQFL